MFRFVNKRAIYRLGIISLAHVPVHENVKVKVKYGLVLYTG